MSDSPPDAFSLILVDGSSYLFRAYHALPELNNTKGMPTGAIYGVVSMLKKLRTDYPKARILVVFDSKGKTTRHGLYPDYKANRPEMPDDLAQQIEPLHGLIEAQGFLLLRRVGVEADDIIGTLAKQAVSQKERVLISTGDKDMAQLVEDHICLVNTMTNTYLDEAGVLEKFGVRPHQIVDYLALMGDAVDNIPGVPKVGPKTAAKWIQQYGSLEAVVEHASEISGKVGEYLREHLDFLPLAKQLVTIDCNVPLPESWLEAQDRLPQVDALRDWYQRLEFKRWLKELEEELPKSEPVYDYQVVLTREMWQQCLQEWQAAEVFAFDTETTHLDAMKADLVGFSCAFVEGRAYYIPLAHDYPGAPEQLDRATVLKDIASILHDENKWMVGQNLKYDLKVLAKCDVSVKNLFFDTMLAAYVLNPLEGRHDMDSLAERYLQRKTLSFEAVAGTGKNQRCFSQVDISLATRYAAEDAEVTLALYHALLPRLKASPEGWVVFSTCEMPLMPILMQMEYQGVLIDANLLKEQGVVLGGRIRVLEAQIFEAVGRHFNIDSTQQLAQVLYQQLGLPVLKKTPKGVPSTAEPVLSELSHTYALPKQILEYRSLAKLKSTYIDKLPLEINPETGRVHTSYHQAATSTGRLASNHPNLQNIPVRSEEGRAIRKAFIAPKGCSILSADYSQVELRIMAHLSGDAGLKQAFIEGLDIHRATAAEIFGKSLSAVSDAERRSAKAINFGLIYGMSAFGLSKQLGIDRDSAAHYMGMYFSRYPGVKIYMEKIRDEARQQGYVTTLFGRRLMVPDIHSKNKQRQNAAERAAINAPMQGTAADIIKHAMIAVHAWLEREGLTAKMLMQVHDELVFECPREEIEACKQGVLACMGGAAALAVPLVVNVGVGDSWEAAH